MIEFQNVHFHYRTQADTSYEAIKDVSLEVHEGELLALLGANGCGKTTLGKLMNGLLLPSSGQILVDGFNPCDNDSLWEIRRRVGMVFQDPSRQMVGSVVEDEVAFGPENLGVEPNVILQRMERVFSLLEIEHLRFSEPHMLSGGQKQRVAIASILVMEPRYIVMDEPTAMLDPVGRREVMSCINKLRHELKLGIIYITHHMEEAIACDRVVVLEAGSILSSGLPSVLFSQVEQLSRMGLALPSIVDLAWRLRRHGLPLPEDLRSPEDLARALTDLKNQCS